MTTLPGRPASALALVVAAAAATAGAQPTLAPSPAPRPMQIHTTARDLPGRFMRSDAPAATPARQPVETEVAVMIDRTRRHQTLLGIGGAITDASAEVFAKLAPAQQRELLEAYFDPQRGIGYTLLRTTIHSSDFSPASYTYVADGDAELRSFDIAPDRRFRLPMIRAAIQAAGGALTTYLSPWSAPAWMKDNGSLLQGGRLKPEFAPAWARYVVKTVAAYEAEGVPVWGLTVQNEPMAKQRWESMLYTAEQERDFIKQHLGPALHAAGFGAKKLIAWDHNRDLIVHRANVILSDPEAAKYVWGIGFHWYETWAGGEPMHRNVAAVQAAWPDVKLLLTEATVERFDPAQLQSWANAERYARQIIEDFNAGAVAWTDWNILLDERGGPNHVGNFCFAPVHADLRSGELVFTPSFAALGHFSKFLRPGAWRVAATSTRSTLLTTAFENPDGRLAVVVMNTGDAAIDYALQIGGQQTALRIPARALQTVTE
jgi:glucosylceramidase